MIADVLLIIFLFSVFAVLHSILASRTIKKKIADSAGDKIGLYRLFYNFLSFIIFFAFLELSSNPHYYLYDLDTPFDLIIFGLQILSFIGLIWAFRSSMSFSKFLGYSQLISWIKGSYNPEELDEKMTFSQKGAYRFSRHPIYLFSILFLALRPTMSLFYFVVFICCVIYFYVGSVMEEKRMIESFGNEYLLYKNKVPRIFPIRFNTK